MTKADLIERVTVRAGGDLTRRGAERFVDAVFDEIREAILKDGRFAYPAFGTWTLRRRRARAGWNPRTAAPMTIAGGVTVGFRPTPAVRKAVRARG